MDKTKILKAGKIASQVREFAKSFIKTNMPLLEIAEKIENKITELGGKPAFPINLSINEIAAHYTPSYNDVSVARGLLKVDFGVQIDGWVADTAFSLDLENNKENRELISVSEEALKNAIQKVKKGIALSEIGKTIQETIEKKGFSPITNLSGHEMQEYDLHAGLAIPNIDNKSSEKILNGLYAIEPFTTNGGGRVSEGKPSGIYLLINEKNVRSEEARKILNFIIEKYRTLPFCSRWIANKFGVKSLFSLKQLEDNGNLHQYPQLIEKTPNASGTKVSQAEHTILIDDKIIVTTD